MNKSIVSRGAKALSVGALLTLGGLLVVGGVAFADNTNGSLSGNTVALGVTQITSVQTFATADGTYADGWKWVFNVNVPANETVLQMKFDDWNGVGGVIPVSNNMQFYSAQSTNAINEASAISIVASGTYSGQMYLNPSQDLDTNQAGRQIQITVEARVPVGSGGGAYSTSYGIDTNPDTTPHGQISINEDSGSPTGNIAKGQTQVTIAKFDVSTGAEAMNILYLPFSLAFTGINTVENINQLVQNITLVDDTTAQVGTTIAQPPSANFLSGSSSGINASGTISSSNATYADSFGAAGVPVNYTIPANTTRVLSLKADVLSSASFSTMTGSILSGSQNAQGLVSNQTSSLAAATGNALTLAVPELTVGQNHALGNQTVESGVTNQEIGSYAFTASAAEGININNLTIQANSSFFQNLKIIVNGVQFGTTQGVVSSGTQYTFSGSPFSISAGGTVNVNVYADTLSNGSGSLSPATVLTGLSGTGQISFSSIGLVGGSVNGQNLTLSNVGATISVTADSSEAPAGQIVMGSTGNPIATFRFTETSNIENVKVTDLKVLEIVASTATVKSAFSNLTLWNGSTELGAAGSAVAAASGTAYIYTFHFATPVIIPQANSVALTLKGDVASYASSGATDNSTSSFEIGTGFDASTASSSQVVVALGATSNRSAAVTISNANGNQQTVLRSNLIFAATPLGATSGRGKVSSDQLATLSFSANAAGSVAVNTISITLTGTAVTSTLFNATNAVKLLDENNQSLGAAVTSTVNGNDVWTFNLGVGSGGQAVSAGSTRNWTLVVNDSELVSANGQNYVNLVATINKGTDIQYTDGLDNAASTNLSLPTSVLTPIQLNSVVFAQGI